MVKHILTCAVLVSGWLCTSYPSRTSTESHYLYFISSFGCLQLCYITSSYSYDYKFPLQIKEIMQKVLGKITIINKNDLLSATIRKTCYRDILFCSPRTWTIQMSLHPHQVIAPPGCKRFSYTENKCEGEPEHRNPDSKVL